MYRVINKKENREMRKMRFWRRRRTDLSRPRLCVFRSAKHVQVQLINDVEKRVIASASSMEKEFRGLELSGVAMAAKIGEIIGARGAAAGVKEVVFDKNGYAYHGRIKALADAARTAGLSF